VYLVSSLVTVSVSNVGDIYESPTKLAGWSSTHTVWK